MTILDTYKFNSIDVAKYIAGKANEKNIFINITKIQKLLYIAYGIYLRVYKQRLTDEHPKAWPYGPVFPKTRKKLLSLNLVDIRTKDCTDEAQKDEQLNKVVDFTLNKFGIWNAGQLTEWSHREGSPWYYSSQTNGFKWGDTIPDELIYNYFLQLITLKSKEDESK